MSASSLVSVLIPAHDAAPYLGEAIESALAQTHAAVEVIVVDDGSSDGTAEVARAYRSRVRLHVQERAGAGAARNAAARLARGELLAFLDADDRFVPGKLARQLDALARDPRLEAVFGWVREFVSPELPAEARARIRPPAPPSPWRSPTLMLIRREAFERVGLFATDLRVAETIDWCARADEAGLRSLVLPQVVLERRLHLRNSGLREPQAGSDYVRVVRAALERRRGSGE